MSEIRFKRLDEKGWAITPRGNKVWFSRYEAILDGKRVATIEGYLGSCHTMWAICGFQTAGLTKFWTLADAKRFLLRHIDDVPATESGPDRVRQTSTHHDEIDIKSFDYTK